MLKGPHCNRPGFRRVTHERKRYFGISETIGAGLIAAGVGEGTAAIAAPALLGAGVGAGTSAIEGGNPLTGAFTGGLTGGALGAFGGAGGLVDSASGLGAVGSDVAIGAGAGALGSAITGQNVLGGAAGGALSGGLAGLVSPGGAAAGGTTAGGASAAAGAAPAGAAPIDLTSASPDLSAIGTTPTNIPSASNLGTNVGFGASGGGFGGSATDAASQLGLSGPGGSGLTTGGGGQIGTGLTPTGATGGGDAGGGAAGGGGGGGSNFNYDQSTIGKTLNSLGITTAGQDPGGIATAAAKNPAALLGGAGLAFNLAEGQSVPGQSQLTGQAKQLSQQGQQLASYLQSGQLPAGAQAAISQATSAAKANARSRFASMGLSGSTQEAQALNQIDLQSASQSFQIADTLLQQGISESNLSSKIYQDLLGFNETQTKDTGAAIANFASSIGGFGGKG